MNVIAIPTTLSNRRWVPWLIASLVAVTAVGAFWLFTRLSGGGGNAPVAGKFHPVVPTLMDIKVKKDGELQAVNNIDIVSRVEGQSTIVEIVKEGSLVEKGDTLVVLDSSQIRQNLEDAELAVQKAQSDLRAATEMQRIQENQNAADIEAAEVELELAKLALSEYTEGTFPESLANAETDLKMAEITVRNEEEELEQTRVLFGKGFVTAAQVKTDELAVTTARNDMRKAETALEVLKKFTYPTMLATNRSAVSQAQQGLARVKITGASELEQKVVAVKTAEAELMVAQRKLKYLQDQLAACTITAPADGLVVYAPNDRYQQNAIAEGAQVRERQPLLQLPDMSQMKAVIRASESQVSKLRVGQRAAVKIVGVPEPVGARLTKKSPIADSGSRWWNPDSKEYPVELTLDRTPPNVLPGMGAQAEIFVERLHDVLTVPLSAIYSERTASYVFVRQGGQIKPQAVTIGQTNETHARIVEGLNPRQEVLILQAGQGRELLEKAGIKPPPEKRDEFQGVEEEEEEEELTPDDALPLPPPAAGASPDAGAPPEAGAPPAAGAPPEAGASPDAGAPPEAGASPDAPTSRPSTVPASTAPTVEATVPAKADGPQPSRRRGERRREQ